MNNNLKNKKMERLLVPNVKIGDLVLRRDSNGGEVDTWEECRINETYLELIKEFPNDYRNLDGSNLVMMVNPNSK